MHKIKKRTAYHILCLAVCIALSGCAARFGGGTLTRRGMAALEREELNTALEDFQQALDNGEDEVMAYRGMGIALLGLSRSQEAAAALKKALAYTDQKMPRTVEDIKMYLAAALYKNGEYEEVTDLCSQVTAGNPRVQEAYFLLGASLLKTGDQAGAAENFDRAVSLGKNEYSIYLRIYEVYEELNLTALGDEYLQVALGIPPDSAEDQYEIARIYYYLGQYEKARDTLIGPSEEGYLPARSLLGEIYLQLGDFTHATAMYETIKDEAGDNPTVYNGLALCSIQAGNYDMALDYINLGLALDEEEGKQQLRFNEIVAYEKKLDFATALEKAKAYQQMYPSDENGTRELWFLQTRG